MAASPNPGDGGVVAVLMLVALVVIVGVAVKVADLRRRRAAEAIALQAQISDTLLREPALARLVITPTVHVPLRHAAPAVIEVRGEVPSPQLRQAVLRLVEQEATRARTGYRVEDLVMVLPPIETHAA